MENINKYMKPASPRASCWYIMLLSISQQFWELTSAILNKIMLAIQIFHISFVYFLACEDHAKNRWLTQAEKLRKDRVELLISQLDQTDIYSHLLKYSSHNSRIHRIFTKIDCIF
ncbi:Hypothetical predicted protein [Marmota monax]|uniref:Uncharacterized protein n=1 Tax=Marmota monax TaxID=9995 RepID=A0A5E4C718_MARMO|nr:hypothetical protein GHT09_010888 [Marmota monax]VTJ76712.1 Hypothetical predicted protein [Marmota monax]